MRRALFLAAAVTLTIAPSASAQTLGEFQRLDERNLKPAPLVPTTAPRSLRPLHQTLHVSGSRGDYAIRINTPSSSAVIALERGVYRSLSAAIRAERKAGFAVSSTRVRRRSA